MDKAQQEQPAELPIEPPDQAYTRLREETRNRLARRQQWDRRLGYAKIAVAILAELVQLRAAGALAGPKTTPSKQAGSGGIQPASRQADATDPVCGMTVAVTSAGRPVSYAGTDYYFCCAGCRRAFEKDPGAYTRKQTRC